MASLILSSPLSLACYNNKNPILVSPQTTNLISFRTNNAPLQPLKHTSRRRNHQQMKRGRGGLGVVCYSSPLSMQTLQWVSTISSAVLVIAKGTAVPKPFLVPIFALQAPATIVSWVKGEYGAWTAVLALLVRLFFSIPAELELPFMAMLLIIVSPYQVADLRGTQAGAIISLIIAGYLAFQHFSNLGNLRRAFDQGSVIATIAVISIAAASALLLI